MRSTYYPGVCTIQECVLSRYLLCKFNYSADTPVVIGINILILIVVKKALKSILSEH